MYIALLSVVTLFVFGVFGNIRYPLLWHDEAETTMFGERILQFGYPKVHDGKNTVNFVDLKDTSIAIWKPYDAYVGTQWSNFYLASVGVMLARGFDDIYTKTALIRIPFAIVGIAGVFVVAFMLSHTLAKRRAAIAGIIVFFILEALSVSLQLHLREVRYYSILLLCLAVSALLVILRGVYGTVSHRVYIALSVCIGLLTVFTFFPALAVLVGMLIFVGLYRLVSHILHVSHTHVTVSKPTKQDLVRLMQDIAPVIVVLGVTVPIAYTFRYFAISNALTKNIGGFDVMRIIDNVSTILGFLWRYEFLGLFVVAKVIANLLDAERASEVRRASLLITTYSLVYIAVIALFPYIFQRYVIVIQPLLAASFVLDVYVITTGLKQKTRYFTLSLLAIIFTVSVWTGKLPSLQGHVYELSHRYKGPLDYVIPFIKHSFPNTQNLVIATQYEEAAYMYYLGAKVVGGYVLNNYDEDRGVSPDIVIVRKGWEDRRGLMQEYLSKGQYKAVSFNVYDYNFNNIPELPGYWLMTHLYKTPQTTKDTNKMQTTIYLRK